MMKLSTIIERHAAVQPTQSFCSFATTRRRYWSQNRIKAAQQKLKLIYDGGGGESACKHFHFELMRRWHEVERNSFDQIIDPWDADRLHQSDWSAPALARRSAS